MSWETESHVQSTEYADNIGEHLHPFPGNELAEVWWDAQYEGGTTRREPWYPGFTGTPNALNSIVVTKNENGHHHTKLSAVHHTKEDGAGQTITYVNFEETHRPVLDIDFPAKLIPSSTEGHFHLYLDKEMPWSTYEKLLAALAEAGIIEEGYAKASIARRYSTVRLPWEKKDIRNYPE